MSKIEEYIEKNFKKLKFDKQEKEDLKIELIEHLENIKNDYLQSNMSEEQAIDTTLKNFDFNEFLKELNKFSANKKLVGLNKKFILKNSFVLLSLYIVITSLYFTLFREISSPSISYFFTICLISIVNCFFAYKNFKNSRDILYHISLVFLTFFSLEFIIEILLIKITSGNFYNTSNIFNYNKCIIAITVIILTLIFVKYTKFHMKKTVNIFSTTDIVVLVTSIMLNLLYFLYPNRFNTLRVMVHNFFNITVQSFHKNLFYMTINNDFVIINLGLLIFIIFLFYKIIFFSITGLTPQVNQYNDIN